VFLFVPYNVDVPMARWPIANWAVMLLTIVVSVSAFPAMAGFSPTEKWRLSGSGAWWSDAGLIGSTLTHADPLHLIGNMLFLFVFGNAINAKLGHALFLSSYFLLGIVSAMAYGVVSDGTPALGASGAIAGITGMFIVLYPRNNVSIFFMIWVMLRPYVRTFGVSAWVVIGCFFGKDLLMQILLSAGFGESGVALMAHLAGTAAGALLASALLLTDRLRPTEHEETALEVLGLQKY